MDRTTSPAARGTPPEPLTPEAADQMAATLHAALAGDFGTPAFPNPEGWTIASVSRQYLMQLHVPVAMFALPNPEKTLGFIVTPTDASKPAYKRTPRYDVVYFSEDVEDNEQHVIYQRDRAMIDRFAAWVARWDARTGGTR